MSQKLNLLIFVWLSQWSEDNLSLVSTGDHFLVVTEICQDWGQLHLSLFALCWTGALCWTLSRWRRRGWGGRGSWHCRRWRCWSRGWRGGTLASWLSSPGHPSCPSTVSQTCILMFSLWNTIVTVSCVASYSRVEFNYHYWQRSMSGELQLMWLLWSPAKSFSVSPCPANWTISSGQKLFIKLFISHWHSHRYIILSLTWWCNGMYPGFTHFGFNFTSGEKLLRLTWAG